MKIFFFKIFTKVKILRVWIIVNWLIRIILPMKKNYFAQSDLKKEMFKYIWEYNEHFHVCKKYGVSKYDFTIQRSFFQENTIAKT